MSPSGLFLLQVSVSQSKIKLVVAACVTAFINNVCVLIAMSDAPDTDVVAPALEEKLNGAIMLY